MTSVSDPMQIAFRVLTSISDGEQPDAADVESLKRYASLPGDVSTDELACDVIKLVLEDRAKGRERRLALDIAS